ncbi:MAG TPA: caspase family protein [Labilithrix sp.]|nr:caspase family protein [Labilithrix sp.]
MKLLALAFAIVLGACITTRASAAEPPRAEFALIVGSNVSVDADVAPLRYADDDAARYFDLFRLLGMRTVLLARIDDSTRRLHPQAAAEALLPRKADLTKATLAVAAEVAEARRRGLDTVVYFVFAGHGGVDGTRGYISLEDTRLTGEALGTEIVSRIESRSIHMILDACNSYLVAYSRGPGGQRRPAQDFAKSVYELGRDPRVGLLLSTSSATESHEWDAFQSGVFSHEVRSGLYGAADADGDGEVSYREMAAFIGRANESIENERFRPRIFARPPRESAGTLLDLRGARSRRVTVDGAHSGRYLLEDAHGVRLADFHNAGGQPVFLVRPPPKGRAYLRRMDDDRELVIPPGDGPLAISELAADAPRVASRGALHESFSHLFALPFDRTVVDRYVPPSRITRDGDEGSAVASVLKPDAPIAPPASGISIRTAVGIGLIGTGALGIATGTYFAAHAASEDVPGPSASQQAVAQRNERVSTSNRTAVVGFAAGGALLASGIVVLLWPSARSKVDVSVSTGGAFAAVHGSF